MEVNIDKPVTVYLQSGMGMSITKIEGRLKNVGTKKWAQYSAAAFVDIIPRGKRKAKRYLQTYNPYMIVLEGANHLDVSDGYEVVSTDNDVTVRQSKYTSFDSKWTEDADKEIDSYLAASGAVVIADFRHTKGYSPYTGKTTKDER